MKSIHLIASLISLTSLSALADSGLDSLKQSFAPLALEATQQFNRAALMKPFMITKGQALNSKDCQALVDHVTKSYKIDPFQFTDDQHNRIAYPMCVSGAASIETEQNYIQPIPGRSNFDLPYSVVIQLSDFGGAGLNSYFIDSSFHVVEIQRIYTDPTTQELTQYVINAVDAQANIYYSTWIKDDKFPRTQINAITRTEGYLPADGSAPGPWLRSTTTSCVDPTQVYETLNLSRAERKDWDDYVQPLTYGLWGFYDYGGKYFPDTTMPIYRSQLTLKYMNGVEHCAFGTYMDGKTPVADPLVNTTAYSDCLYY
jgi:hypothetical protein